MNEETKIESPEIIERPGVKVKSIKTVVTSVHEENVIAPEFFITGTKFKCKIQGNSVEGRLHVDYSPGMALLCQNEVSGYDSGQLPGYKHSWSLSVSGDKEKGFDFNDPAITDLELELDPEYKIIKYAEHKTTVGTYDATITSQIAKVGCQRIPFECVKEVYEAMLELQMLEKETE